jgi:protein-L-isoaspartate(D-aspartate) O-methyltransferase
MGMVAPEPERERLAARREMVERQLKRRGIDDERVLSAMLAVPRHAFVRRQTDELAYDDCALGIGEGQTISQPYMVARACELAALTADQRALEVGAGSGYQAAVLSKLCAHVTAVELLPELAARASRVLAELRIDNVSVEHGDGTLGWPARAPYDAILVSAGGPEVPPALLEQLATGGRLVMPLGPSKLQELTLVRRQADGSFTRKAYDACRYVPLRGSGGWADEDDVD